MPWSNILIASQDGTREEFFQHSLFFSVFVTTALFSEQEQKILDCFSGTVAKTLDLSPGIRTRSNKNIFSVDLLYAWILALWLAKNGHMAFISQ